MATVFRKIFFVMVSCAVFAAAMLQTGTAQANPRYASFVMDAQTGAVLSARYADKKLHPASLTKVMTLLMVFDALDKGKLRMSDRIYVSKHAASMIPSKLGLKPRSYIRVRDAILAMSVKSANDVAVAVAEHLGGTERNFARMMTFRAKQLGMKNTRFVNASGLHNRKQISTARDMATMARYVISNYPQYYKYYSKASFSYQGKTYRNHNHLLGRYPGMDGMKTGYVRASGFNLIASAVHNDRRIIAVVFGGKTSRSRNAHMVRLLDAGFRKLPKVRMAHAKIPLPDKKPEGIQLASLEPMAGDAARPIIPAPAAKSLPVVQAAFLTNTAVDFGQDVAQDIKDAWAIQVAPLRQSAKP